MRQFLLGGSVAYSTGATPDLAAAGAIGFYYLADGKPTIDATGANMKNYGSIVLGRLAKDGGPVVLPFYNNNFSYTKAVYSPAKVFKASFTIGDLTIMADHSVMFIKKGIQFNERACWTATEHVHSSKETAEQIAAKIAKFVNLNSISLGLTAVVADSTVTVTAIEAGKDYEIKPGDALFGTEVTYVTRGEAGFCDAENIKKMANMAAADAGFEYTYMDDVHYLYPGYPLEPLAQPMKADTGFTVYTMRFAVPRDMKTRDEVVNQIVQIAVPTGAAQIATLDTVLAKISTL